MIDIGSGRWYCRGVLFLQKVILSGWTAIPLEVMQVCDSWKVCHFSKILFSVVGETIICDCTCVSTIDWSCRQVHKTYSRTAWIWGFPFFSINMGQPAVLPSTDDESGLHDPSVNMSQPAVLPSTVQSGLPATYINMGQPAVLPSTVEPGLPAQSINMGQPAVLPSTDVESGLMFFFLLHFVLYGAEAQPCETPFGEMHTVHLVPNGEPCECSQCLWSSQGRVQWIN